MLRFIVKRCSWYIAKITFQYIPCYGLSYLMHFLSGLLCVISIHPMLRFIQSKASMRATQKQYFNTSHVTVYQDMDKSRWKRNAFQYIPCYGLSRRQPDNTASFSYFNTSHVTVYLSQGNISNLLSNISIHPMLRFIMYRKSVSSGFFSISIHPMLRFIVVSGAIPQIQGYFNTSHVTVYRPCTLHPGSLIGISIHPMLRFIGFLPSTSILPKSFQYIPCYGLSLSVANILYP